MTGTGSFLRTEMEECTEWGQGSGMVRWYKKGVDRTMWGVGGRDRIVGPDLKTKTKRDTL